MKLIIAGSRTVKDYQWLCDAIQRSGYTDITEVVSGKEPNGADALGERWAKEHDIPIKDFPADWDHLGLVAGPIRNTAMAEYADAALILRRPLGMKSYGSDDLFSKMKWTYKKPLYREIEERKP
jgi:hypothetical protein